MDAVVYRQLDEIETVSPQRLNIHAVAVAESCRRERLSPSIHT
jgi:hypothetical protein